MAHPHADLRSHEQANAEAHLRRSGYARGGKIGGDEAQDKAMVAKGVHQHERHDHSGEKPTALKLRGGGSVKGDKPRHRPDKMARGGSVKGRGGPAKVNIIISNGAGEADRLKQGLQAGTQIGGALGAAKPPMPPMMPHPPMAPPPGLPPGMPPGGAPPMMPPPGAAMAGGLPPGLPPRPPMKRGGRLMVNDDAGGGSGEGRLEKAGMEDEVPVRAHVRRKAGGRV